MLPVPPLRNISRRETALILAVAAAVTAVVGYFAWLSEDCFITLRYVDNTIHGYGPVFNVGEHVQGFTHPLWFMLLVLGSLIFRNPMLVAYGVSFLFTFLTVLLVGRAVLRVSASFLSGALIFFAAIVVWISSDPWLSFQTSGLESSLSHLLIVAIVYETWILAASRRGQLALWMCLACLSRPDFVIWMLPPAIVLLAHVRTPRQFLLLLSTALPGVAWLVFSYFYYDALLANPFYAKVGIYSSVTDAVGQGLAYLTDWLRFDALAAGATILFFALAAWRARTAERIALLLGMILFLGWIVYVGGDFMRGRFFMPLLIAAVFAGTLALAEMSHVAASTQRARLTTVAATLTLLLLARILIPVPPYGPDYFFIANERQFYPGYSLGHYLQTGRIDNPYLDMRLADALRNYARNCGPITIHSPNPGTIGYLAGPDVSVIDSLGLTDSFIAHLPRENLVFQIPKPGHAAKYVPISYLLSRKDLSLLPNWIPRVERGECGMSAELESLKQSGNQKILPLLPGQGH